MWNLLESTHCLPPERVQKEFLKFVYKRCYEFYVCFYVTKFVTSTAELRILAHASLEKIQTAQTAHN